MQELLAELARNGLLAVLLAIALWGLLRKDQSLTASYKDRLEDHKKLIQVVEATNATAKALETISENRTRVVESMGEAAKASAGALEAQRQTLADILHTTQRNSDDIAVLRDDMERLAGRRRAARNTRTKRRPAQ